MGVKYLYGIDVTGQSTFSTNVGIGTLSPGYKLTIAGSGSSWNINPHSNGVDLYSTGNIAPHYQTTYDWYTGAPGSGAFKMRLDASGNLGVGTTAPASKLHVNGYIRYGAVNAYSNTGLDSAGFYQDVTGTTAVQSTMRLQSNVLSGVSSYNGIKFGAAALNNASEGFTIYTGGYDNNRLSITAAGNVGIGTASPTANLHILDAVTPSIKLEDTTNSNEGRIRVANNYMYIDIDNPNTVGSSRILFTADSTTSLYLTDTEAVFETTNVGIGTTSPTQKLDVAGGDIILSSNATYIRSKDASGNTPRMFGINPSNDTYIGPIDPYAGGSIFYGVSANVSTQTLYTGASARLHINSAGNVGIGTTSPSGKLSIEGDGTEYSNIVFNQSAAQEHLIYASTNFQFNLIGSGTPTWIWGQQGASERMRLNNTGLGIGTTSPAYKLDVAGNGRFSTGQVWLNTDENFGILRDGNDVTIKAWNGFNFVGDGASQNLVKIDNGGNVGIGTTSPIKKLAVSNNGAQGLEFGINTTAEITAYNRTTSTYIPMYFDASVFNFAIGNVGIGTTSPVYKLDVAGIIRGAGIDYHTLSVVDGGAQLRLERTGSSAGLMYLGADNVGFRIFDSSFNTKLILTSSGNLLIGTTADSGYKLDVAGTGRFGTGTYKVLSISDGGGAGWGTVGGASIAPQLYMYNTGTNAIVQTYINNTARLEVTNTGATVAGAISIINANLSNQENLDVDTGTEVVSIVPIATYTAAFFDFVVKNGTNVRSGTVYACHDGTSVEYTETSTADLGNTSAVVFTVDISAGNMRLLATTTTDNWSVKTLTRTI